MSAWAPLLPSALVGTDRQGGTRPELPGALGELLAALPPAPNPATVLLRAAAAVALAQTAGRFGHAGIPPLPAPAGPETRPEAPADPALQWALQAGPLRLQAELCAALEASGQGWPAAWLPAVLELGRRTLALRGPLAATLGVRGRWLAAQRDDWRWAAGSSAEADDHPSRWDEGSLEQRLAFLRHERRRDPAAGAARLQAALPELPARERALLASALAEGLSGDDEPLLETLRRDRAREVRQQAQALLLHLPDAAWSRRAAARLAACLTPPRGLLARRWAVEPPAAAADDWAADGLEAERAKHEPLGERAWWLLQLVCCVAPAWWTAHTGLTPGELLRWADAGDWAEALRRGWREALAAAPEPAWCEAWLQSGAARADEAAQMTALLPAEARERVWRAALDRAGALGDDLVALLVQGCPAPQTLSAALSRPVAEALARRLLAQPLAQDWPLRAALPDLACLLHPGSLPALRALPRGSDETASEAEQRRQLERIVDARLALERWTPDRSPA